jgi:hypothetical protein
MVQKRLVITSTALGIESCIIKNRL